MTVLAAQTIEEIKFYLLLRGLTQRSHATVMLGDDLAARYVCVDAAGRETVVDFQPVSRSLRDGPVRSHLIDAGQWLRISDQLTKNPDASKSEMVIASLAMRQVLVFCGAGEWDEPGPEAFFTVDGKQYRDSQSPGTFQRARLEARLRVYESIVAEHGERVPAAAPAPPRRLVPVLKQATSAGMDHCATMPLPGMAWLRSLVVAFAEDPPDGYHFVPKTDPQAADPGKLFEAVLPNLLATPRDLTVLESEIAVHAGADSAADLVLHPGFLNTVAERLGAEELWVGVPHRRAFYAVRRGASHETIRKFSLLVRHELARANSLGLAPLSDWMFRVKGGRIVGVCGAELLGKQAGTRNWNAAFILGVFGLVLGFGIGLGISAYFNVSAEVLVLGLAPTVGGAAFAFGLRFDREKQITRAPLAAATARSASQQSSPIG